MSLGKINTYGSKWGTNYPWQKAMLLATRLLGGSALLTDSFTTTGGTLAYTRPLIVGRTVGYLIDDTNGTILVDGVDYIIVGPLVTFTLMPAPINIKILYN